VLHTSEQDCAVPYIKFINRSTNMSNIFHPGELAVQRQAGVQDMAKRVGKIIKASIPLSAANFFIEQAFAIFASVDPQKQLWASILTGKPSFMYNIDAHTLLVRALPHETDPLFVNVTTGSDVGMLAIDFATRRRMRLNGTTELHKDGFIIRANQVYANCPKYIQQRTFTMQFADNCEPSANTNSELSREQVKWITSADTFFIATAHPTGGADASHRGGNPGFVHVRDNQLIIPDYSGNLMFNTLGNIVSNPNTGLLFLDFKGNRSLQLTGQAEVVWDEDQITQHTGAERLILFDIKHVIETQNAMPFVWSFQSFSPVNPT
jgi:predicted pyridoxine 5'-phosphate oxidase superfamily flavin-nucleotide-binding protein